LKCIYKVQGSFVGKRKVVFAILQCDLRASIFEPQKLRGIQGRLSIHDLFF